MYEITCEQASSRKSLQKEKGMGGGGKPWQLALIQCQRSEDAAAASRERPYAAAEAARPLDDGRPDEPTTLVGCRLAWRRPLLSVPGGDRLSVRDVLRAIRVRSQKPKPVRRTSSYTDVGFRVCGPCR